jgi:hypothetical protein
LNSRVAAEPIAGRVTAGALRFFFEKGSAKVFAQANDIDLDFWRATFGNGHKDFEYYRLLEETVQAGFSYRYLVLFGLDERALALQPLIIVDQDLATAVNGHFGRAIGFVRRRAPRFLHSRMLVAGCLVGDGKLGVISGADPALASGLLGQALREFAHIEKISIVTLKDFPSHWRQDLAPLQDCGFTRLDGFPSLKLDLDFDSVDDYMQQRLTRVTRKNFKRKLKKTAAANPKIELEVLGDCSAIIDEIYPLYLNVAQRSEITFEVFTKQYFLEAGRRLPGHVWYFVWRQNGRAIAFSFCTVWGDTIYDNDIGLDYSVAHELNLYHLTFHDILAWAIKNNLGFYETAPFNYEVKLHLRLQPVPLDVYIRHKSPLANLILKLVAPLFAPAKSDVALRKYSRIQNRK